MMKHEMRLNARPFSEMVSGTKKSELRLNDEKRQQISVGDEIVFTNRENESEQVKTRVIYLKTYPDFGAMYEGVCADYPTWEKQPFIDAMYQYYSPEDEKMYGTLEIGVELVS